MSRTRYPVAVALLFLSGCHAWRHVAKPGASGTLEGNLDIVRVTRTVACATETPTRECVPGRSTITLYAPRVEADSLIGRHNSDRGERVAVHVLDIVSIESQKIDPVRTVVAGLGTAALILLIAIIAWFISLPSDY